MKKGPGMFTKKPIAVGITTAILALSMASASAAKFELGGFDVTFDSTFAIGASWRTEDRDYNLIGKATDPRFNWTGYSPVVHTANPIAYPSSSQVWNSFDTGSYSSNGDAGNLNFDPGKTFSKLFKGTHDLDINKGSWGVFTRFTYFYDFEMMDESRPSNRSVSGASYDPCEDDEAKDLVCRDFRLLDAYVYADFDLNDGLNPLSVRVGEQVLNWGESTLISHGINNNPVDIARLRAPGAELKEAFIPVGMVWASLGVTDDVNVELYYQYDWQETYLPAPGSYFSTNDFAGEGGYYNTVQLGFGGAPETDLNSILNDLNSFYATAAAFGIDATTAEGKATLAGLYVSAFPRRATLRVKGGDGENEASDSGQYGIKLSIFSPELHDTEFGFYFMNYHSNRPLFSGRASNFTGGALQRDLAYLAQNTMTVDNVKNLEAYSKVLVEYPEDIKLFGLSFNTTLGNTAVSGEVSFRQDEPLQIDDVEILFAGMPQQLAAEGVPAGIFRADLAGISQLDAPGPGEYARGYIVSDTTQAQMTFTHLLGPTWGTDNLILLAELGATVINDLPDPEVLRLNGPGTGRSGPLVGREGIQVALENGAETNPFASKSAWGYRLIAKADFNNVFAGINVSPRLVFSHDVNGITPDPIFLFVEDRKSLGMTLSFDYQSRWSADVSYNRFWGGQGTTNTFADRDYVSFSIKYSI
ncbi:MAG: hypothetical protein ACI9FJ_002166 [Alteromonadaceae bacterium]|jgi:hypothetical protein